MKKQAPATKHGHSHAHAHARLSISRHALEAAAATFAALGEPARLELLAKLVRGERCVSELVSERDTVSVISQRLRVLRTQKLVARRREGKHIYYALADQHVLDLVQNALAHASESPSRSSPRKGEKS